MKPEQWNNKYYFPKWWGVMLVIPIQMMLISIPLPPLFLLLMLFENGYLPEFAHVQIPDWFNMFSIGLMGSWVLICIKFTEKLLIKWNVIVASQNNTRVSRD